MDIGLFLGADGGSADLAIANGDFMLDSTLNTSVIISLMTDRLADADAVLPDGGADRRGWWGDAYLPPLPDGSPDAIGSLLWLYRRVTATQENANFIAEAAQAALQWMVKDGDASSVTVTVSWASATALLLNIVIAQLKAMGVTTPVAFQLLWDRTLGTMAPVTTMAAT